MALFDQSEFLGGTAFVILADVVLVLASLLVIGIAPVYLMRLRDRRELAINLANPASGALLATFPAGLLVFGAAWGSVGVEWLGDDIALTISAIVALIGGALCVVLSIAWASLQPGAQVELADVNGAWLIPSAMNLIVPLCIAPQVIAHPDQATWLLGLGLMFYGIGALLFIPTFTLVIARLALREPPPNSTMPALWIPLAPAGLLGLSLLRLMQAGTTTGVVPESALVLGLVASGMGIGLGLWWALFATVRLTQVRRSGGLAFSPGWWGFVFPIGALVLSMSALADQMQSGPIDAVAFVGLLCFVVVWIVVAVRSATAVLRIARSA